MFRKNINKLNICVFAILTSVGISANANARTCTAPGHPSCTITCPAGCAALYYEPNGPCRTICSGRKASGSGVGIDAQGMTQQEIIKELNKRKGK